MGHEFDGAGAEPRLSICGDDHKSAAALIRESRCVDEAVAKIRGSLDKGSHQGCIALAKHESMIQLVTEALREFPEARQAVIAAVERSLRVWFDVTVKVCKHLRVCSEIVSDAGILTATDEQCLGLRDDPSRAA